MQRTITEKVLLIPLVTMLRDNDIVYILISLFDFHFHCQFHYIFFLMIMMMMKKKFILCIIV